MYSRLLLLILLISPNSVVYPADTPDYEAVLTESLVGIYSDKEAVWLSADDQLFLGLYRESVNLPANRAIVILHGMGAHADWPEVITPLRTRLPVMGWTTLSIQLPVLAPQTSLSDYGASISQTTLRIRAAIKYLQYHGYVDIVLLGYSFGASLAVNYLQAGPDDIRAFAGISMQEFPFLSPPFRLVDSLGRVKVPVLDIYAGLDFSDVLRSVDDRRLAASKGGNVAYQQQVIKGSDHYYTGRQDELVDTIMVWLETIVPGHIQMQPDPFYLL
jgi:predicted esterase